MFTVRYGKQTFGNTTESVMITSFPLISGFKWAEKKPITVGGLRKVGTTNATLASSDGYKESGSWYTASYESGDEPIVISIMLTRRVIGVLRAQCNFHVVPNELAGYIEVNSSLTPNQNARFGSSLTVFAGGGYVVNYQDLIEYGVDIVRNDKAKFFDQEEIDDEFTVEGNTSTQRPEVISIPTGDGGSSSVFIAPPPTRRMRLRPK